MPLESRVAGMAVVAALVVAGCGQAAAPVGTPSSAPAPAAASPPPALDRAAVDRAILRVADAVQILADLRGRTLTDLAGEYKLAESALRQGVAALDPPPAGAPVPTVQNARAAWAALADGLAAARECLTTAAARGGYMGAKSCDSTLSRVEALAAEAGKRTVFLADFATPGVWPSNLR